MIAVGLAAFAAVAGGIRHLAVGSTRFVDDIRGFSIRFPSQWSFEEGKEGAVVLGLKSLGNSEAAPRGVVSVNVETLSPPLDPAAFRAWGTKVFSGSLPEYQQVGEGTLRFADLEAPWVLYTYVGGPQKRRFKAWQFYLARKNRGYVITCTSEPATFERFRPDFEEIARSFRFE